MPVHNWKGIDDGIFHDLHCSWIVEIKRALNGGLLPPAYHAMAEQRARLIAPDVLTLKFDDIEIDDFNSGGGVAIMAPPKTTHRKTFDVLAYVNRQNSIAIRHSSDDKLVAVLEIVSRGNKTGKANFDAFMLKAHSCLNQGIHFTYVDVHPPSALCSDGIHGAMCVENGDDPPENAPDNFLSAAGYEAGSIVNGYVNCFAIGDPIPDTPLFLHHDFHVMLPLEATYMQAFASYGSRMRTKIELNLNERK
jgi:hypothetical protein